MIKKLLFFCFARKDALGSRAVSYSRLLCFLFFSKQGPHGIII